MTNPFPVGATYETLIRRIQHGGRKARSALRRIERGAYAPGPPPHCLACEDTGYEPGMPGYYCTFCSKGCAVAQAQLKAGIDPWGHDESPYVCPGCHAVGGERCAPDCVDAEMEREAEEERAYGSGGDPWWAADDDEEERT